MDSDELLAKAVRQWAMLAEGVGPSDHVIASAVKAFAEKFDYWYTRVMADAVAKYRTLIVGRVNPFVRRLDCEGLTVVQTAARFVADYDARNFVTAGGWALEALAINLGGGGRKSGILGIDVERIDAQTGAHHLYIVKSGLVTRNSDIVSALKRNIRDAEKRLRQSDAQGQVVGNWAVAAGRTTSTFEDGIRRPSSAEFWSEMSGLPQDEAVRFVIAIAVTAGGLFKRTGAAHAEALRFVVADYMARRDDPGAVDWEFLALRTLRDKAAWTKEDAVRHSGALQRLAATGYQLPKPSARATKAAPSKPRKKRQK